MPTRERDATHAVISTLDEDRDPVFRLPDLGARVGQDEEFCEVWDRGAWRRVRFHDYADIYTVPGLYEKIFDQALRCQSPQRVVGLLSEVLRESDTRPTELRVLDLGAGNGMVGEELRRIGVQRLIGADIIPEAAEAADRDRPGIYDRYHVEDFTDLPAPIADALAREHLNCLVTVAALGFGDIPPDAFASAFNLVEDGGWTAFNVKETFLSRRDETGFARLIHEMNHHEVIRPHAYRRYRHRLSVAGESLHYVAIVARKNRDIPAALIDAAIAAA